MKKLFYLFTVLVFITSFAQPALAEKTSDKGGIFSKLPFGKKGFKKGDLLRITTSKTLLKSSPKPFGSKILKTLQNGDTVSFIEDKGSWLNVDFEGTKGFIPQKSLIEAKKFKSFSKTAKVTETDMAAATKGFSPEVEKKNRENKELRYDLLDKAEKGSSVKAPQKTLKPFRKKGKLGEFQ